MSISSISAVTSVRPAAPTPAPAQPAETPERLGPAVRIDIRRPDAARDAAGPKPEAVPPSEQAVDRRHSVDPETKTIVYQVVDQASGDVVVQIPDAVVLKSRAYADAVAARKKAESPVDRTA